MTADTSFTLDVMATMSPAPPPTGQAKGYRLFIGADADVSPSDYLYQKYFSTTSASIAQSFDNAWFDELGFRSGDAIFASIYADVSFNQETVLKNGSLFFPNLGEMQGSLASVVLP